MACEKCGSANHLQIHHINYDPPITIILCRNCHQNIHKHGVGMSPYQIKNIPDDFPEIWKNKKRREIMEIYHVSIATVYHWAKKTQLKLKVIPNTMDKTLYSHNPSHCSVTLRDRGAVTIPPRIIKALNLKKDDILILDVRRPE